MQIKARVAPELVDVIVAIVWHDELFHGRDFPHRCAARLFDHRLGARGHGGGPVETAYGLFADFVNVVRTIRLLSGGTNASET